MPNATTDSIPPPPDDSIRFFAPCALNVEPLLAKELTHMGLTHVRPTRGGVAFAGTLEDGYRACLWSRLASRVLMPLSRFFCATEQALYDGIQRIDWAEHLARDGTLAVDFTTSNSKLSHSHYGALKVKDAVVDQFRDAHGERPSVDTRHPDLRINLYLYRDEATVSIDFAGHSLHRRGYRVKGGKAPLKETLAATILAHARWPEIAASGGHFVDLMCGSGTLLIEAAMMAADVAPGLGRGDDFAFTTWLGHDHDLWDRLWDEAKQRQLNGLEALQPDRIHGFDQDVRAVRAVGENLYHAGLEDHITVTQRDIRDTEPAPGPTGLVVANPPYGERLGADERLNHLYAAIGGALKAHFSGWRAAVLTGNPELARNMRLGADKKHTLYNGAIPCKLLHYGID